MGVFSGCVHVMFGGVFSGCVHVMFGGVFSEHVHVMFGGYHAFILESISRVSSLVPPVADTAYTHVSAYPWYVCVWKPM